MSKGKTKHYLPHDQFFLLGFGLFFLGVVGGLLALYQNQQKQIDHLFSDRALAVIEIKLNRSSVDFMQTNLGANQSTTINLPGLMSDLAWGDFSSWIGKKAALSWFPNQQFIHAFDYRRTPEAREFMRSFLLPEETLAERPSPYGTIYTPSYSSNNAFMFYKGWLFWADAPETLNRELTDSKKLYRYKPYQQLQKDLPSLQFIKAYLNFAGDTTSLTKNIENQTSAPLMRGLGRSTPQWGASFKIKDNILQGDMKILTDQAVYDPNQIINKAQNSTIPDLAYFAPKNTLFFQNGHDLYAKYQHTKNYLNQLDPQLSLVFEGLIRAQAETWFGTDFDFESEFLNLIRGPYAFILDFNQGLEIGFISALGPNQKPEAINQLIQKAQSRFTPVTEKVELPDGTTREELIATDPQNVPITKAELLGQTYYSARKDDGSVNFSYSQIGDYLVMTNRSNLVQKIISTHTDQTKSLAANDDFRKSVMFDFSPAEVYGFLNAPKLKQLNFYWQETQNTPSPFNLDWAEKLRNLTFSKQVFPQAIFIKLRWFFN